MRFQLIAFVVLRQTIRQATMDIIIILEGIMEQLHLIGLMVSLTEVAV